MNTVKVIDALLKVETPRGPAWHRYNGDGYGEHDDGSPFDGTGVGRAWPLLTGERAHYELAAGRRRGRAAGASDGGVRRRQPAAAGAGLGQPRHSRARALHRPGLGLGAAAGLGARRVPQAVPVDCKTAASSISRRRPSRATSLRERERHAVRRLAIQQQDPHDGGGEDAARRDARVRVVHWSVDGWKRTQETATVDVGLGVYVADLATSELPANAQVDLTFYWPEVLRWEDADFQVLVA